MDDTNFSRRRFTQLAGTMATAQMSLSAAGGLTARDVINRIQASLGGDWSENGSDGFKAGDPNIAVKGIVTTAMATLDVLRQASKAGANLILTYEPTFYGRADGQSPPSLPPGDNGRGAAGPRFGGVAPDDPVYSAKKDFIESNGLVVFRLRDHWQASKENYLLTGLADSLGWTKYRVKPDDAIYDVNAGTAEETVAVIRSKLGLRGGLRAVGDRRAQVRRVFLYPGTMTPATMWQRYSEVDMIVAGEVREWENTHYAADMFTTGEKRGLVTIGRVVSEDPGMGACAAWLNGLMKEVPARWIKAGDPYWRAS